MKFKEFYRLVENDLFLNRSNFIKLYHGTNSNNLKSILQNGLISNSGKQTHKMPQRGIRQNWVYTTNNKTKAFISALPHFQNTQQYNEWGDPVLIILEINPEESILELEKEMKNVPEKEKEFLNNYIQKIKEGNYDELVFDKIPLSNIKGIAVYKKNNKLVSTVYGSVNSKTRKDMVNYFNKK